MSAAAADIGKVDAVHRDEEVRNENAQMTSTTVGAAASDATPTSSTPTMNKAGEAEDATSASSFVNAAATVQVEEGDVENQQQPRAPSSAKSGLSASAATAPNVGIFAGDEDDTASVFSFDSIEKRPRIPLRVQNMIRKRYEEGGEDDPDDSAVPFPSVVGASMEYENAVNVCPCRCLFFTLTETICLIMSALGCAVFLTLLILLCMYLEGSAFNNS